MLFAGRFVTLGSEALAVPLDARNIASTFRALTAGAGPLLGGHLRAAASFAALTLIVPQRALEGADGRLFESAIAEARDELDGAALYVGLYVTGGGRRAPPPRDGQRHADPGRAAPAVGASARGGSGVQEEARGPRGAPRRARPRRPLVVREELPRRTVPPRGAQRDLSASPGGPTMPSTSTFAPSRFGRYLLLARLGAGGMAVVHRAVHQSSMSPDSSVALKRVRADLHDSPGVLQMFVDEARIASRLVHENLGRVIEMGCEGQVYYQTMEYLPGVDLHELLRADGKRWALPIELAAYVGLSLAEGLEHVHRFTDEAGAPMSIVHRDVNPKNVRLTFEGRVVLLDFGVARSRHRLSRTDEGMVKGKLAYLAPEQLVGAVPDGRTDLFALGITLYEMLTGQHPFSDRDVRRMFGRMRERGYTPIAELCPEAPAPLARVIERALEPDPEDRWQTAGEIAFELRRCLKRSRARPDAAMLARLLEVSFPAEHRAARDEDARIEALLGAIARGEIDVREDEEDAIARACGGIAVEVALDDSGELADGDTERTALGDAAEEDSPPHAFDVDLGTLAARIGHDPLPQHTAFDVDLGTLAARIGHEPLPQHTAFDVDLGTLAARIGHDPLPQHTAFDVDLGTLAARIGHEPMPPRAPTEPREAKPSLRDAFAPLDGEEAPTTWWRGAPDAALERGPGEAKESLASAIDGWLRSRAGARDTDVALPAQAGASWRALEAGGLAGAWTEPGAPTPEPIGAASSRNGDGWRAVGGGARIRVRA
ncbi:MAG: serine/threonine protein kinase [Sandaracinaceae bacterium]|nr:serine/threonine protein kinase [Sandaracinaceae bacterium]